MALFAQPSLTRRRLGLIVAALFFAVLLSLSRTPAAPDAASPGTDKVIADRVEHERSDRAPAPVMSSLEKAMAMAEQRQSPFSSTLGEVLPSDEIDVFLFSTSIEEGPAALPLTNLERELFGAGPMLLASAGDLPDTPFFSRGPYGSNQTSGVIGFGGGGSAGVGSGGGASSGGIQAGQNAASAQNHVAANANDPNGSSAGNSPANHPGNGRGSSNGNSGRSNGSDSGANDESPFQSGPGRISGPGPSDEDIRPVSVPEPSVLSLVGVGLAVLVTMRRRYAR